MRNNTKKYQLQTKIEHQVEKNRFIVDEQTRKFGNQKFDGMQYKGTALYQDELIFIKKDSLNLVHGSAWKNDRFDLSYSSVNEDICSCFLKNCKEDNLFQSVIYYFEVFESTTGKIDTGSISKNYVVDGSVEKLITSYEEKDTDIFDVSHEEFLENIIDGVDKEKILASMIEYFVRNGINEQDAKHFIIQQAGFDLLTGNIDRKVNSKNIVFLYYPKDNVTIPLNMDYGRCLQTYWAPEAENSFISGRNNESLLEEIASDDVGEILTSGGGLFGNKIGGKISEAIDFLFENNFQPFELNFAQFEKDLEVVLKKVEDNNLKIKYFVKYKIELIKSLLQNENMKKLWKEVQ